MDQIIDLSRYPLDRPESPAWQALVEQCRGELLELGMFNLPGFLHETRSKAIAAELDLLFHTKAFHHSRLHNIYFRNDIDELAKDHPALRQNKTSNRTLCADQIGPSPLVELYEWPPFARFLATVIGKPELHPMADPLARINVMAYQEGEALNWHFDRSEFTTTLLLQEPDQGGVFEYARDLRSAENPNYDGVGDLLNGVLRPKQMQLGVGTLNVFRGVNTAHRVTPVVGPTARMIAVFSYFDRPGIEFSAEERIGFYGRKD